METFGCWLYMTVYTKLEIYKYIYCSNELSTNQLKNIYIKKNTSYWQFLLTSLGKH